MAKDPEEFWREILSGDERRIREAVGRLAQDERGPVEDHLRRMAMEAGWTEGQRTRARAALEAMGWTVD